MRRALVLAALAVLAVSSFSCGKPAARDDRPNVLVILVDALRADRLGVNGYPLPTTPAIDRLAAEGVTFSRFYAHSTWTKPSIASLFTSLYPSQHGIKWVAVEEEEAFLTQVLPDDVTTMAERFRDAGYATGAVVNQVHLLERFGFAQGFEFYKTFTGKTARPLNRNLVAWFNGLDDRPFFGYLHYLDVHWPYTLIPGKDAAAFGPVALDPEPPHGGDEADAWAATLETDRDVAALAARYDREVRVADDAIGELVAEMKELGLYENTIIVVLSDHGEGFMEHGRLQHGYPPYEEVIHVPWVMRLPERLRPAGSQSPAATRIDDLAGMVDVMPTLLDLAGLEPPEGASGASFAPLVPGAGPVGRPLFAETTEATAARRDDLKLIYFVDGRREIYDLAADPGEQSPLETDCAGPCRELARELVAFVREMAEALAAARSGTAELSPEEIEELKSLGYL